MKYVKNLAALFLLAGMVVSCGSEPAAQENNTDAVMDGNAVVTETDGGSTAVTEAESEEVYIPDVPDSDFGGYAFKFLQHSYPTYEYKLEVDLLSDGMNGETINDAVFTRNTFIEDNYNIKIAAQYEQRLGVVTKYAKKAFAAGDDCYDVINERICDLSGLIATGAVLDLNLVPYLDFSKPWWDSNSLVSTAFNHKNYIVASDIYLSDKYATSTVLFNKKMAADFDMENLYELVLEGKWTLDKIRELSKSVSRDLNGDGKLNEEDQYGMLGRRDMTTFFFHSAGGRLAELDADGMPADTFYNDHNVSVVNKIFEMLYDTNLFFNVHVSVPTMDDSDYYTLFRDGHSLFYVGALMDEVGKMRESGLDFGIIPNPKYDETQKEYHNTVSIYHTGLLSVPSIAGDLERTGIILEAMSAKSKEILQPAYYETVLKGKSARDTESEDMIDIIFGSRVFDIGDIMNFGGFSYDFITVSTGKKSKDIASFYESYREKIANDMEKYAKIIEELP